MLTLLGLNEVFPGFTDTELEVLGTGIADGSIDTDDIQAWIEAHVTRRGQ